jgi:hypothetical protein
MFNFCACSADMLKLSNFLCTSAQVRCCYQRLGERPLASSRIFALASRAASARQIKSTAP